MDYKDKYEQALERCKKVFNFSNLAYSHEEIKERLEHIFPELKESDDEKIRKALIQHIKYKVSVISGWRKEELIAWLEKQGEQTTVSITDEWIDDYWQHHKVLNTNSYDKGEEIQFDHDGFSRFCKQFQNTAKWSEEDESLNVITQYLNIYKRGDGKFVPGGVIYPTEKSAKEGSLDSLYPFEYVKTIKIEI